MTRNSLITRCAILLSASVLLFACKKQVAEPQQAKEVAAGVETNNDCRATVLGMQSNTAWNTLMQRWYNSDGKVAFLKAKIGWNSYITSNYFLIDLAWGEMTYAGNQVYLKDVYRDKHEMRVTLDDDGRAVAS